jgi:hypothetical protein
MFRNILGLGVVSLIFALIATLFRLGVVSVESWMMAKVFFSFFLVLVALAFVGGYFTRTRNA